MKVFTTVLLLTLTNVNAGSGQIAHVALIQFRCVRN